MLGWAARLVIAPSSLAYRLVTDSPFVTVGDCVRTIQDEELAVASDDSLRSVGLPSREQLVELLDGAFTRAGYEIEEVLVSAGRPARVTVVADSENGLDLDAVATLSRLASELLDELDGADTEPYELEITSRGVDRPLTGEKHFRRARGRRVEMALTDGSSLTGRLGQTADGVVHLVVADGKGFAIREIPVGDITKAIVQVEFSTPNRRELELSEQSGKGTEA
jgi:ribosome maturation factor RimP